MTAMASVRVEKLPLTCENRREDPGADWHRPGAWSDLDERPNVFQRICTVEDCDRPALARRLCSMHYARVLRARRLDEYDRVLDTLDHDALDRFLIYVDQDGPIPDHAPDLGPCWLWLGSTNPSGYGQFSIGRKGRFTAHRWHYIRVKGPVADDLQIDHLCRVTSCVNPEHLEAVTASENCRRQLRYQRPIQE
jgi:HNH endonuclease